MAQPKDKPSLKPIAAKEWAERVRNYQERKKSVEDTPDARYELGRWAFDQGLEDEAWEQWVRAVKLNPDHEPSRRAMGYEKEGNAWVRPGKPDPSWREKIDKAGRAYSFTIAIEDDAGKEFFEDLSWRVRRLNWFLWRLVEGQAFLKKIRIEDKTSEGRFVIERGKLDLTLLEGGGAFCTNAGKENWQVRSGGRCYVRILCHEMLHGIFGLPDERGGCACLMQGGLYGIRTDQIPLCDRETHKEDDSLPDSCWELIRKRFPEMAHPNPVDPGRPPDVEIEIADH